MSVSVDFGASRRHFGHLVAYRALVKYLVLKEIRIRSRGTYLGVAWTLMNPLLTIVTYFVVFQYIFHPERPLNENELDPNQFSLVPGGYFEAEVNQALREIRELVRR